MIDRGRREGKGTGRFLLLGSAAIELLAQSGETLAGRIAFAELAPFDLTEVGAEQLDRALGARRLPGELPRRGEEASLRWRRDFIRTYLERDIPSSARGSRPRRCGGCGRCSPTTRAAC